MYNQTRFTNNITATNVTTKGNIATTTAATTLYATDSATVTTCIICILLAFYLFTVNEIQFNCSSQEKKKLYC